jgi:hypothetical protein
MTRDPRLRQLARATTVAQTQPPATFYPPTPPQRHDQNGTTPMSMSRPIVSTANLGRLIAATAILGACTLATAPQAGATTPGALTTLIGVLPHGYSADNCTPITPSGSAIAAVHCAASTDPGGPTQAVFALYTTPADTEDAFRATTGDDALTACPDNEPSPGTWHYNATPDQVAGSIACGTYNGQTELIWTDHSKLLTAVVEGPDITSLYRWWLHAF